MCVFLVNESVQEMDMANRFIKTGTHSYFSASWHHQDMLHHCRAVSRGCRLAFKVGDMPFGSYEISPQQAIQTAQRFLKEGQMDAVKLEGGREMAETVRAITRAGIPVLGHVGLTPQRISALGGFRAQGKTVDQVCRITN